MDGSDYTNQAGLQHLRYFSSSETLHHLVCFFHLAHPIMTANHFAYQAQKAWIWDSSMESFHRHQQSGDGMGGDKEPMFEKLLTPSDVGKLNRLVIPKQHAEKYFPLDGDAGDKGLLLSFEDDSCKLWRFRYSYWTSSQSYVLTKGWSRFVKEKRLDAGDVILFLRRRSNGERLYIGCRRRGASLLQGSIAAASVSRNVSATGITTDGALPWDPALIHSTSTSLPPPSYVFLNSVPQGEQQSSSEAAAANTGITKRLRLFGVNLECGHLFSGSQVVTTNASGHQL